MRPPSTSWRRTSRGLTCGELGASASGTANARPRCGRCWLQGRPGARWPPFHEHVSPDRPPNPACRSPGTGSPRGPLPTNGCVDARLRSTRPGLPGRTPVFTGGSCPADTARSLAVPLRPVAGFPGPPTTTGTPPRPATNSGRRTCPPPEGGRAAMGRFPRSLPPGRRGRCPAIPRQPRQGYAAALLPGLLTGHYLPAPESLAATATGVHCTPAHIRQVGAGTSLTERQRWFLAYTFSSCLPDPARLAVPARPGVVRAAPTLPYVSTVRLPSAPPACCDRPAAGPFHPRPVVVAPRGAGNARCRRATPAPGVGVPRSVASPGTRRGPCRPSAPRRRWTESSTAGDPQGAPGRVRVTHPFHPLSGREFDFAFRRTTWGEDRVLFIDGDGNIGGLPAGWTDAGPVDPFVVVAAGRSPLHVGELLELAGLLERLRAGEDSGV